MHKFLQGKLRGLRKIFEMAMLPMVQDAHDPGIACARTSLYRPQEWNADVDADCKQVLDHLRKFRQAVYDHDMVQAHSFSLNAAAPEFIPQVDRVLAALHPGSPDKSAGKKRGKHVTFKQVTVVQSDPADDEWTQQRIVDAAISQLTDGATRVSLPGVPHFQLRSALCSRKDLFTVVDKTSRAGKVSFNVYLVQAEAAAHVRRTKLAGTSSSMDAIGSHERYTRPMTTNNTYHRASPAGSDTQLHAS